MEKKSLSFSIFLVWFQLLAYKYNLFDWLVNQN